MNPKTAALAAKTNPVYTGTASFGRPSQMNAQQRQALRRLGARNAPKPASVPVPGQVLGTPPGGPNQLSGGVNNMGKIYKPLH